MSRKKRPKPRPKIRPCVGCGELYQPYRNGQKFCTDRCRGKFWRRVNKRLGFEAKLSRLTREVRRIESSLSALRAEVEALKKP